MKYVFIILFFFIIACKEAEKRPNGDSKRLFFEKLDTVAIDTTKGVPVADSVILSLYLNGEYQRIVDGNYRIDNLLKKGLYSASLSSLSRYEDARKYLSMVDKIGVELTSGEIRIPVVTSADIDFYSFYSLYKYLSLCGGFSSDECLTMIDSNYDKVINDSSGKLEQFLLFVERVGVSASSEELMPEYRGTMADLNRISHLNPLSLQYPVFQFVKAQLEYLQDSNLVKYKKTLREFNERNFQREYNIRLLLDKYINPKVLDSSVVDSLSRVYRSIYPAYCNTFLIDYKYFTLEEYDSLLYISCKQCIESGMQRNVLYANVLLGYYYLRNGQFTKLDSLVGIYRNETNYSWGEKSNLRLWELSQYYALELAGYFLRKDFEKFRDLAYHLEMNGKFRTDYRTNREAYKRLTRYFYKWYVNRDMKGYDAFIKQYKIY